MIDRFKTNCLSVPCYLISVCFTDYSLLHYPSSVVRVYLAHQCQSVPFDGMHVKVIHEANLFRDLHPLLHASHIRVRRGIRHRLVTPDNHLIELCLGLQSTKRHFLFCIDIDDFGLIWSWCFGLCWPLLLNHHAPVALWHFHRLAVELSSSEVGSPLAICIRSISGKASLGMIVGCDLYLLLA